MTTSRSDDHPPAPADPGAEAPARPERRRFLSAASGLAMAGGLTASYGTLAGMAGRFLYPPGPPRVAWLFVTDVKGLAPGASLDFESPSGERIAVARTGSGDAADAFVALSSVCPHLGCQVHWEAPQERFFCPCHNGTFDASGRATGGPPGEAGQWLSRYPLKVTDGLLFIEVPLDAVRRQARARDAT